MLAWLIHPDLDPTWACEVKLHLTVTKGERHKSPQLGPSHPPNTAYMALLLSRRSTYRHAQGSIPCSQKILKFLTSNHGRSACRDHATIVDAQHYTDLEAPSEGSYFLPDEFSNSRRTRWMCWVDDGLDLCVEPNMPEEGEARIPRVR